MRALFVAFPLLYCIIGLTACGKDEPDKDPSLSEDTRAVITVKNAAGEAQSAVSVYLFDRPAIETGGDVAENALRTGETDADGEVSFGLYQLEGITAGSTVYFTALEEESAGAYNVLGTVEAVVENGVELEAEMTIADPTHYGFYPTTVTSELAMSEYNRWRSSQVRECNDGLRVIADPASETKVEAIGFGMLLSAYADDQETFDGLFRFYQDKRTEQANNMMAWSVTCDGILDPGSATDGDVDVAFALIVADKQWGGSYLESAKEVLEVIRTSVIVSCTVADESIYILAPGYSGGRWGGCGMTDLMYHTPAFFRAFAEVTGDGIWAEMADDTYVLLNASAHPETGLVPDWQTAAGVPGPGGRVGHFGYDACRAPWRITLDYLWNGNPQAKEWASKISGWAVEVGPQNIVDGYELDGTPIGTNGVNSSFLGGFAVAAMSHSKSRVNTFGTTLSGLNDTYWFNLNTRCLYLFTLTGMFRDPMKME